MARWVSIATRTELSRTIEERYRIAKRGEKGRILGGSDHRRTARQARSHHQRRGALSQGSVLHTLYVGWWFGQRITLEDVACGLGPELAPAIRLYEVMWNNWHGRPTAAGFIADIPNARVSDVVEIILDQRLNDILPAMVLSSARSPATSDRPEYTVGRFSAKFSNVG